MLNWCIKTAAVRAAFEMGDPEGEFLGVETEIDDAIEQVRLMI